MSTQVNHLHLTTSSAPSWMDEQVAASESARLGMEVWPSTIQARREAREPYYTLALEHWRQRMAHGVSATDPEESSMDDDPIGCLCNAAIASAVIVIATLGPLVFSGAGKALGLWIGGHI